MMVCLEDLEEPDCPFEGEEVRYVFKADNDEPKGSSVVEFARLGARAPYRVPMAHNDYEVLNATNIQDIFDDTEADYDGVVI